MYYNGLSLSRAEGKKTLERMDVTSYQLG